MKETLTVLEDGTIPVPHLGFTLRTLLAVAADNAIEGKRQYSVTYKGAIICKVRIKNGFVVQTI
jgi:hypothetical protein